MKKEKKAAPVRQIGGWQRLCLTVLAIVLAFLLGLFIPSVTSVIQNLSTDRLSGFVDLGEGALSLTSDESKIGKLRTAGQMLLTRDVDSSQIMLTNTGEGKFMTYEDAVSSFDKVLALMAGTELSISLPDEYAVHMAEPVEVRDFSSRTTMDLAWQVAVSGYVAEEDYSWGIDFLIDDATGIVLAISCVGVHNYDYDENNYAAPDYSDTIRRIAENMASVYGLTDTELVPAERGNLNPFMNTYYINFVQDREVLYQMPVTIGLNGWGINVISYY